MGVTTSAPPPWDGIGDEQDLMKSGNEYEYEHEYEPGKAALGGPTRTHRPPKTSVGLHPPYRSLPTRNVLASSTRRIEYRINDLLTQPSLPWILRCQFRMNSRLAFARSKIGCPGYDTARPRPSSSIRNSPCRHTAGMVHPSGRDRADPRRLALLHAAHVLGLDQDGLPSGGGPQFLGRALPRRVLQPDS